MTDTSNSLVARAHRGPIAILSFNDPDRRNALSMPMFDALDCALEGLRDREDTRTIVLRGEGRAFCAGFDLGACVDDPSLMPAFIHRLSHTIRAIRRLPQPVIAAVHGAAVAGGCALLSACDHVFVEAQAQLGYPVHRIGISPAVTLPTLMRAVGPGPARALVVGGKLIDGREAVRIGLAHSVIDGPDPMLDAALAHAERLAAKPPRALCILKAWLNELDGIEDDHIFDETASASATAADTEEAVRLLRAAWAR